MPRRRLLPAALAEAVGVGALRFRSLGRYRGLVWGFYLDSFDGEAIGFGECAAIIEVRLKGKILRIFGKRILTKLGDACIIIISVIITDIEKKII